MRIELHCHSTCSDGALTPGAVAAQAAGAQLALFALTDHDTCAGSAEAQPAGVPTRRAVELSCDWNGRTVHILAYDTGGAWHLLEDRLAEVREARRRRLRVMAAKLGQRGITVDPEPILAAAGDRAVGRPDLARALVERGVVTSMQQAFTRFLRDGGPVDVPNRNLSIDEALTVGRAAGARLALAHPHLYGDRSVSLLQRYRDAGLDGLEAYYGHYDAGERTRWRDLASKLDLVCTGGSDFHQPGDPAPGVEIDDAAWARLATWLGL
ncbi:MAG: PHP domain-containing protein [Kofleriaceae bacterium]|nr:PHP domain-containing protein [Kofleriaceae bacterium]MBP6837308.1 PHP domain-containing protein [Kofleriaceae bacterium]